MSLSHGLQFFMNCSSIGLFHGVDLQGHIAPASVTSSASKSVPAWALQRVTASFMAHPTALLHTVQVVICSTIDLHECRRTICFTIFTTGCRTISVQGAEAHPLLLLHWLWSLRSSSFHIFSVLSPTCCCTAVFILKFVWQRCYHHHRLAQPSPEVGPSCSWLGTSSILHGESFWHLLTEANRVGPSLPKPCHRNATQYPSAKENKHC